MITVLPVETPDSETVRLLGHTSGRVLEAREKGRLLGAMALLEEPGQIRIAACAVAGWDRNGQDPEAMAVGELMVRAAASYAANRFAPRLIWDHPFSAALARRLYFAEKEGQWLAEVSRLVRCCKNCEKT